MKITVVLVLIALMALTINGSCKKEAASARTSLIGSWELREASGQLTITYPAGNGQILEFTETEYKQYNNGQIIKSGSYSIEPDNTVQANVCLVMPDGQYTQRLKLEGDSSKIFMQLFPGKLVLVSGCFAYDAGSFRTYFPITSNH